MRIEHVLAGYFPDSRGRDGLALAATLARTTEARLTVANVHPPAWETPGLGKVDAEWRAYLHRTAEEAIEEAIAYLTRMGLKTEAEIAESRGSGRGLAKLADQTGADIIVIGSAPGGREQRIAVGSTADQLLHGSPVAVGLAPRGYASAPPGDVTRITAAYRRSPSDDVALKAIADMAAEHSLPLRLLTLFLRGRLVTPAEEEMLTRVRDRYESDLNAAVSKPRLKAERAVATGVNVERALQGLDWLPGEIVTCGSSSAGPLRKVFTGDMSLKIIRAAPCPTIVLPRSALKS